MTYTIAHPDDPRNAQTARNVAALQAMADADFPGVRGVQVVPDAETRAATLTQHELTHLFTGVGQGESGTPRAPFEQVAALNRAIGIIADSIKQLPLMISTLDDRVIETGDVVDLLACPYPGMTGEDLVEWIAGLLPLTGGANLIRGDAGGDPLPPGAGRVRSLRPVGADRCRPLYDDDGAVDHYRYTPPGSKRGATTLEPDQVIRWTRSNYHTQRFADGLSLLKPGRMAIDQVYGADRSNRNALIGGLSPTIHINFPGDPGPAQVDNYRRYIKQMNGGPERSGEPLITWGDTDVKGLSRDFGKMLIDKLKMMSIIDVCVLTGVPPAVLGYVGEGGLGHGKETEEAHQIFWVTTMLPLANWIARRMTLDVLTNFATRSWRELTRRSRPMHARERQSLCYRAVRRGVAGRRQWVRDERGVNRAVEPNMVAWFDVSNVAPLIEAQLKLIEKGQILIDSFAVPVADFFEAHDMPYPTRPHHHQATRPIGRVPIEDPVELSDEALGVDEPIDDMIDEDTEERQTRRRSTRCDCSRAIPQSLFKKLAKDYRALDQRTLRSLWESWVVSWDGLRRQAQGIVERHWMARRVQTLRRLREAGSTGGGRSIDAVMRRDLIQTILFEIVPTESGSLVSKLGAVVREAQRLGGEQTMDESAAAQGGDAADVDAFDVDNTEVRRALLRRDVGINSIERRARRRVQGRAEDALREAIAEGLDRKDTLASIERSIKRQFNIEGRRAATVARTEIGAAVEEGRQLAREQANVPMKSWLSSRKAKGRANHLAMEMQSMANPIAIDQPFILPETGGTAQQPRAATLGVEDVVNCACTTVSRFHGDRAVDVVARMSSRGFVDYEQLIARRDAAGKDLS